MIESRDGRRVVITGVGVVASCGIGAAAFWTGLRRPPRPGTRRPVLGFDPEGAGAAAKTSYSSRLAEAEDDLSVCCGFLEHVRGRAADDGEAAILAEALESVRLEGISL